MPRHRTPSYRHHKPSGRAVVTLDGRDFYLGHWNSEESKAEYDRLVAQWITNGRRLPTEESDSAFSVAELGLGYLRYAAEYYQNDGETTSELQCIKGALKPLHELYALQDVSEFGPLSLVRVPKVLQTVGQLVEFGSGGRKIVAAFAIRRC